MWGIIPFEYLEDYEEPINCRNGAYQGKAVFEGEAYADEMLADDRR